MKPIKREPFASPVVKWAGRLLCVLLWFGIGATAAAAVMIAPGLTPLTRNLVGFFVSLTWVLMAASLGPTMWYVTEPLPDREPAKL
jgi:hypothetical protein